MFKSEVFSLDLDKWIHDPPPSDELEEAVEMDEDLFGRKGLRSEFTRFGYFPKYGSEEEEEESVEKEAKKPSEKEVEEITEEELSKVMFRK